MLSQNKRLGHNIGFKYNLFETKEQQTLKRPQKRGIQVCGTDDEGWQRDKTR